MKRISTVAALVMGLATTGCAAKLSVVKVQAANPTAGVVYRLPVPKVRVSTRTLSRKIAATDPLTRLKWAPRRDVSVDLVTVPSDEHAYGISVEPGTFTLDAVGVTLGEGGTLDTYNGKSASQVKDVVEALAKVALTAATILAASPAQTVVRPASPAENAYFQELLNLRARISRRLVELDQKTREHALTTAEIDANKEKRKPLEARQKVVAEKSTLAKARLDALQIKLSKSGLSVAELENLKQVDVQSKALDDEKKGLDQKLDALAIKSPVAGSKLSAEEQKESTELVTLLADINKKLDPDPDLVTSVELFDLKLAPANTSLESFVTTQTGDFIVVARRITQ
jgi:hypothetical protein